MLAVMTLLDNRGGNSGGELITLNMKDWHEKVWMDMPVGTHYSYLLFLASPVESHLRGYFLPGYVTDESKG
jgi:hypothetical protein